jgi:hypothetical protein
MSRVLLVLVLVLVAAGIAAWFGRRQDQGRPVTTRGNLPTHVRRSDFVRPDAPWLVVLFSSATCASCAEARQVVEPLESDEVAVTEIEFTAQRVLHERYDIDSVPSVIVCDGSGAVRAEFLGPPKAADLWSTMAELRDQEID